MSLKDFSSLVFNRQPIICRGSVFSGVDFYLRMPPCMAIKIPIHPPVDESLLLLSNALIFEWNVGDVLRAAAQFNSSSLACHCEREWKST